MSEGIHSFRVEHAQKFGLNAAILLQSLIHWIGLNRANNHNFLEGHYWVYNSTTAFAKLYPYLTPRQVRCALDRLIKDQIVIKGHHGGDPCDRRNWYAFKDESKWLIASKNNPEKAELPESTPPICPTGQMHLTPKSNGLTSRSNAFDAQVKSLTTVTDCTVTDYSSLHTQSPASVEHETKAAKTDWGTLLLGNMPPHSSAIPDTPLPNHPAPSPQDFELFWQAYPRKVAKQEALKVWMKQDHPPVAQILTALEAQKKTEGWRKSGGQYIPHPTTWLNQGRWADEVKIQVGAKRPF